MKCSTCFTILKLNVLGTPVSHLHHIHKIYEDRDTFSSVKEEMGLANTCYREIVSSDPEPKEHDHILQASIWLIRLIFFRQIWGIMSIELMT